MKQILPVAALALCLAACSPEPADTRSTVGNETVPTAPARSPAPSATDDDPAADNLLTLEGLGTLKIGQPVSPNSGWAERGAQISDVCRIISSPDYSGVYAIAEGGKVRRVTLGERSDVTLIEGIGVGATEAEVRAAFPGFRETPHEYIEAPGKYLTAPNAESGDTALRFEIGADGRVSLIHIGTMPVLGYVEGCA